MGARHERKPGLEPCPKGCEVGDGYLEMLNPPNVKKLTPPNHEQNAELEPGVNHGNAMVQTITPHTHAH